MWYVIQVTGGKEKSTLFLIEKIVDASAYGECFIPSYKAKKHLRGEWQVVEQPVAPGYLFVSTEAPERLAQELKKINAFARILGDGSRFYPLQDGEDQVLQAFTQSGSRALEISEGYINGDKIVITAGPLMGCEAKISNINRHKRIATLNLEMCGRMVEMRAGLEIVRKVR